MKNADRLITPKYEAGSFDDVYKNIVDGIFGPYPESDQELMKRFLQVSQEGRLPDLDLGQGKSFLDLMPGNKPLVYSLKAEIVSNPYSWQVPSESLIDEMIEKTGIDYGSLDNVVCREVVLGKSSGNEIRAFSDWVHEKIKLGQDDIPIEILPAQVFLIKIPKQGLEVLSSRIRHNNPAPVMFRVPESDAEDTIYTIARIIFGGPNWIASVRSNYSMVIENGVGYYHLSTDHLQEEMVAFLEGLPMLFGHIESCYSGMIEGYIQLVYDKRLKLCGVLEAKTLALFAGWQLDTDSFAAMYLLTLGGLLVKDWLPGDGHWADHWDRLPVEFQLYAFGCIKTAYQFIVVIVGLLMRNIFPDPEIMCTLLNLSQEDTMRYLISMICHTLKDKTVEKISGDSREKMMGSIVSDGKNAVVDWKMIGQLAALIPSWPSIPNGGARFLHTVRAFAMHQYAALKQINYQHSVIEPDLTRNITEDVAGVYMMGRNDESIDNGASVNGFGLQCNPEFVNDLVVLDPYTMTDDKIANLSRPATPDLAYGIIEWGRLNVHLIDKLMLRLKMMGEDGKVDNLWFKNTFLYTSLRLIHHRVLASHSHEVPAIEDIIRREVKVNSGKNQPCQRMKIPQAEQVPGKNHARNLKNKAKRLAKKDARKGLPGYISKAKFKRMRDEGLVPPKEDSGVAGDGTRSYKENRVDLRFKLQKKSSPTHSPRHRPQTSQGNYSRADRGQPGVKARSGLAWVAECCPADSEVNKDGSDDKDDPGEKRSWKNY